MSTSQPTSPIKALYLHGAYDARIGDLQLRAPRDGDTLLKVAATGLCGSDLHYYKDGGIGSAVIKEPFVPGHEFAGWLTEDIPERGLKAGDLVAVDPNVACHACEYCERGHTNLCPNVKFIGAPGDPGAMTQYIWVPKQQLFAMPAGFTPLDAVMLEPLGVAIHAIDLARPKMLERVVVLGCGTIGLLIQQLARVAGAGEVIAIDPIARRREIAAKLGATRVHASIDALKGEGDGKGFPLVIEATNSPDGFREAVQAARIGARMVLVGIPDGDSYTLSAAEARRRGLTIRFSRRAPEVYPRAIEVVRGGHVDVASIVSHKVSLEATPGAFRAHADADPAYVKTLVYPNGV